jgi:hypothetical protein
MGRHKRKEEKKETNKKDMFDNALDPVFMEKHIAETKRVFDLNLSILEDIRDGKITDSQYDPKLGQIIDRPISMDVRVKAIAQINAMTLHKVMADKRDPGRAKDIGKGINHEESLRRIAAQIEKEKALKRQEAEKAAEDTGKLVKLKKENMK